MADTIIWVLILAAVVVAVVAGFLIEHLGHEHGHHCRCSAHPPVPPRPEAAERLIVDADTTILPVPPIVGELPSWPMLYGPRIAMLEKMSWAQLRDLAVYISGFDAEAVDKALELLAEDW
jgi:hypothetical protein